MHTHLAQMDGPAPEPLPQLLRPQEGPFRELDLLAIGAVLVVVMTILGARRFLGKRHHKYLPLQRGGRPAGPGGDQKQK